MRFSAPRLTKHPFAKYVVLSVIAHVVLAIWAYTARLLEVPVLPSGASAIVVELGDGVDEFKHRSQPWDELPADTVLPPAPAPMTEPVEELAPVARPGSLATQDTQTASALSDLRSVVSDEPGSPPLTTMTNSSEAQPPLLDSASDVPHPATDSPRPTDLAEAAQPPATLTEQPTTIQAAEALSGDRDERSNVTEAESDTFLAPVAEPTTRPVSTTLPPRLTDQPLQPVTSPWGKGHSQLPIRKAAVPSRSDGRPLPTIYRDRQAEDRLAIARTRGGSAAAEAAVRSALTWLAANQSADGRWDASRFGSGGPTTEGGQDRQQAGLNADTGVTGLAILAFLGAGHTHHDAQYGQTVQDGVEFLLREQQLRPDGSLVGSAGGFAAMYCHGIATLALSECYALTGDAKLLTPVRRAVAFTLAAQHPVTGGWRYQSQQPGDTSQLGWQLMALTSAHYGGVQIPRSTWTGAGRFLDSVAWGSYRGLAAYRPGERPSTAMTAEALLCRLFLGLPPTHPLVDEAASYLIDDLPGVGRVNYYYWYYGTLALYQLQDARWSRWNAAVQAELLRRQRTTTSLAGSWDADSVWGASGGRVYTTSLATLTLEVYYRYRPLGASAEPAERRPEQTAWNQD